MAHHEWSRGDAVVTTDPGRVDLDVVHGFLAQAYWCAGISRALVARSIEHSVPFGIYCGREQVGFARVISDHATFAYLADVFVKEEHRGKGLGKWLIETIVSHPELQGLRRFVLATRDAQELYRKFGFVEVGERPTYMHRFDANVYEKRALDAERHGREIAASS